MLRSWRTPLAALVLLAAAIGVYLAPSIVAPPERPVEVAAQLEHAAELVRTAGLRSFDGTWGCMAVVNGRGAFSDDPENPRCHPDSLRHPVQPLDAATREVIDRILDATVRGQPVDTIDATWTDERGLMRVAFDYGCHTYIWQPGHPITGNGRGLEESGTLRIDDTWWVQGCDTGSD